MKTKRIPWNKGVKTGPRPKKEKELRSIFSKERGVGKWNKGKKHSEETKHKMSLKQKGRKITWADKISNSNKGQVPWNKGKKLSKEIRVKMSLSSKHGKDSHSWRGGKTNENKLQRKGIEFRLWREAVFVKNNWTCQVCKKRGGDLHPDHIKMFAYHPDLRFATDNGRTLCINCHRKTKTYATNKHVCC